VLLVVLLPVCTFAPGFFFARKLRWNPVETLCAAAAISLMLLYAWSLIAYTAHVPEDAYYLVSIASLVALLLSARDLRRLLSRAHVKRVLRGFGILLAWCVLLLLLVRHYSGGTWGGDWLEHYQRDTFFLGGTPKDTLFIGQYLLSARPPLANLVTSYFLAQTGSEFEYVQLIFAYLGALAFLPCALMLSTINRRGRRGLTALVVLLAASPMFVQNVTYPWTKLPCAFFVIFGIGLYLRGWRKGVAVRTVAAFGCLALGCLVHYSAAPYALFVGAHYVVAGLLSRKRKGSEVAGVAGFSAIVLASWFLWSIVFYGFGKTFGSNTSVTASQQMSVAENVGKVARNILYTCVPYPIRAPHAFMADKEFEQPGRAGYVRDVAFLAYQHTVPLALGSIGAAAVIFLLITRARGDVARRFWWPLLVAVTLLGIAAHGSLDIHGVAHIGLQPLVLLGLTFLAANFPSLPRAGQWAVATGCALDFALGILLHFMLQSRVFHLVQLENNRYTIETTRELLAQAAQYNFFTKRMENLSYLGDLFAGYSIEIGVIVAIGFVAMVWRLMTLAKKPPKKAPSQRLRRARA
jgi:hypothetical protein